MQRTIRYKDHDIVLHGRSGDPYFDKIVIGDRANDFLIAIVARYLPSAAVIFDVGANVGVTSAVFAVSQPAATIYSFEPSPETFGFLCETVRPFGNVKAFRIAMSDKPGMMRFYDNETSASASHLSTNGNSLGGSSIEVSASTVDQFVKERSLDRVDLIKIDVEGFEPDVISGARQTIERLQPGVFVEVNSFTLIAYRNFNPRAFVESSDGHVSLHVLVPSGDAEAASIRRRLAHIPTRSSDKAWLRR